MFKFSDVLIVNFEHISEFETVLRNVETQMLLTSHQNLSEKKDI